MLPVIDVSDLVGGGDPAPVAAAIDAACRRDGFFVVVGHGIDPGLGERLERLSAAFFARPADQKAPLAMANAGQAWRGWFPPGGELTSGRPDGKEGLYLGVDGPPVRPLHGRNLYPEPVDEWRAAVGDWLAACESLGRSLLGAMAIGLGLRADWFDDLLGPEPVRLFRIFSYPPVGVVPDAAWGVAEHTDYGLLTVLRQDDIGGLEVRGPSGWVAAPPVDDSFVVNLGDMVERMTRGVYRSTPHRVLPPVDRTRLSMPFFLDPAWDAVVPEIPGLGEPSHEHPRWDGTPVTTMSGTYGDHLVAKVAKVFPALAQP